MTDSRIPKIEKEIYEKLDFTNEICRIRLKYNNDGFENQYFKLNEVKVILKSLGYPYEYSGENSHILKLKIYEDISFEFIVNIKRNIVLPSFLIFKNGKYFGPTVTNLYSLLNHLTYDESLLNPNFRINTLDDLKNYVLDIIDLCNKFVDEYIKEIEAGNVPN